MEIVYKGRLVVERDKKRLTIVTRDASSYGAAVERERERRRGW